MKIHRDLYILYGVIVYIAIKSHTVIFKITFGSVSFNLLMVNSAFVVGENK